MPAKNKVKIASILALFLVVAGIIFIAFSTKQPYWLAAATLILAVIIIAQRQSALLLPLMLGAGMLALLLFSADLGITFTHRLALGLALGAAAGYSLTYCLTIIIQRQAALGAAARGPEKLAPN
jgi:hypothetical protein